MEVKTFVGGTGHQNFHFLTQDPDFDPSYFSWTFVRHPYTRIASAYYYGKKRHSKDIQTWWKNNRASFPEFIEDLHRNMPRNAFNERAEPDHSKMIHLYPQTYFIKSRDHQMDYVGKFENLESDWKRIITRIRIVV